MTRERRVTQLTWKVGIFDSDGKETARSEEFISGKFIGVVGDDREASSNDCTVVMTLASRTSTNISATAITTITASSSSISISSSSSSRSGSVISYTTQIVTVSEQRSTVRLACLETGRILHSSIQHNRPLA